MRNKPFWVGVFALIAITGQTFSIYQVPAGWEQWVNSVLFLMAAFGVFNDPTTDGISDKE